MASRDMQGLLQNGLAFPFDSHFTFFCVAATAASVRGILYMMPKSIDSRATEDDEL